VSSCVSGCASGCLFSSVAGSLLRCEEGDSVIDTLIETGDDSREDGFKEIDIGTDIDIRADIEEGKATDILIEVEGCGAGS
jgi:hypothetical protein